AKEVSFVRLSSLFSSVLDVAFFREKRDCPRGSMSVVGKVGGGAFNAAARAAFGDTVPGGVPGANDPRTGPSKPMISFLLSKRYFAKSQKPVFDSGSGEGITASRMKSTIVGS